jgi:hypothetical protein
MVKTSSADERRVTAGLAPLRTVPRGSRGRLWAVLGARDAAGARAGFERDLRGALNYVASRAGQDGVIRTMPSLTNTNSIP